MERPILFSGPMVQAILNGRKTQTRRIIKIPDLIERPDRFRYKGNSNEFDIPRKAIPYDDRLYHSWELVNSNACSWVEHSVKPGDVLWVRETYMKHPDITIRMLRDGADTWNEYEYIADLDKNEIDQFKEWGWKTKPSIFMPKEACRIKLLVKDIRVERLQDISAEDAKAEGIDRWIEERMRSKPEHYAVYYHEPGDDSSYSSCPIVSYETLWQKINGPDSWDKNPWVWVIQFEKILS